MLPPPSITSRCARANWEDFLFGWPTLLLSQQRARCANKNGGDPARSISGRMQHNGTSVQSQKAQRQDVSGLLVQPLPLERALRAAECSQPRAAAAQSAFFQSAPSVLSNALGFVIKHPQSYSKRNLETFLGLASVERKTIAPHCPEFCGIDVQTGTFSKTARSLLAHFPLGAKPPLRFHLPMGVV